MVTDLSSPPGVEKVRAAAEAGGLTIEVRRFPEGTKTAQDAAGVRLGPIDKSLIFAVDDEVVRSDRRDRPPVLAESARPHPPPV